MPAVLVLAWLVIVLTALVGWVMNIIALVGMLDGAVTALFIARIVGVFIAPLGAVLGLFV
ncbi:hypothetical protein Ga0061061_11727 [Chelatococcus sambhunathii]|uniref:Uncharacterized protein n=1 Tax=Chelatococcus sambhunathii TaxID=363953 RepID=A0ABP2A8W4_9HYPH|nr:hypothetical protein [Chelatococcus sambhunathii]CUA90975.1 hypothetical protein Ga0061061_11727 [Chelatococcus sambhunathii]